MADYIDPLDKLKQQAAANGVPAWATSGLKLDNNSVQELLRQQAAAAGGFADYGEGGFKSLGTQADNARQMLMDQATGKLSYSREALRQGLQQNLAGQQSFAASAMPNNAGMAAFNAQRNMARLGSGLAGQQALAGIAEQEGASKLYADATLQQRAQELQAALQSRQNALTGYGTQFPQTPTFGQQFLNAAGTAAGFAAKSDERLKTNVKDGGEAARAALEKLSAYEFNYKDEKHGKGKQVGVMAQDLERAGLGHTIIDEPDGKAVHGAKAATTALALIAHMNKRLKKVEGE